MRWVKKKKKICVFLLYLNKSKCISSNSEKHTQNRNERLLEGSIISEDAAQNILHVSLSEG